MSDLKYYIPKYTDEPERILFCTVNELIVGASVFMGLSWIGHEMLAILSFMSAIVISRRLKATVFKNGFSAFLYWYLPPISPLDKELPKSSQREYLG